MTLKEIHASKGGNFGYKVKADRLIYEVIGYSGTEQCFVVMTGYQDPQLVNENAIRFKLVVEPQEIWINFYSSGTLAAYLTKENSSWSNDPDIIRRVKFREVLGE